MAKKKTYHKKSWDEFRRSGLMTFMNSFLHIFGWAIVLEVDDGKVTSVYPARTVFRGFPEQSMTAAYQKVAKYMAKNHESILKDAMDG